MSYIDVGRWQEILDPVFYGDLEAQKNYEGSLVRTSGPVSRIGGYGYERTPVGVQFPL